MEIQLPDGTIVDAIESRRNFSGMAKSTELDLKGGQGPRMLIDQNSFIQPVYIVGVLPGVSVATSAASSMVVRSSQRDAALTAATGTAVRGTILTVPDGASFLSFFYKCTTATTASQWIGVDWSNDGVNWFFSGYDASRFDLDPSDSGLFVLNHGKVFYLDRAASVSQSGSQVALPKFVAIVLQNSGAGSCVVDVTITVS